MQFKNIISTAMAATMVTMSMAAPLPVVPTKEFEFLKNGTDNGFHISEAQKKQGMQDYADYWEQASKPPPKEKPEGCLKWHLARGVHGACELWEEGAPHSPDGAPTVPKGTDPKDYPPTNRDVPKPSSRPIGHTRKIPKEDIGFRKTRPEGCIRWVSRGPLSGYCGTWEDDVVHEEDIPEDKDGEPPFVGPQNSEMQYTSERQVGCVDFVEKGTTGYCRKWENVEIPKEEQPYEDDGSDGNRHHSMRTCSRRPELCMDWTQVEPTRGFCSLWSDVVEVHDADKAKKGDVDKVGKGDVDKVEKSDVDKAKKSDFKKVEKRDVGKVKAREKSPFDIPMPFWTIAAL
ncbi:hypothetical protein Q7P35_006147 [Cladosporium inversicolor]